MRYGASSDPVGPFTWLILAAHTTVQQGFLLTCHFRREHGGDNAGDAILSLMHEAGFVDPTEVMHQRTIFGRIFYFHGAQPRRSATGGA